MPYHIGQPAQCPIDKPWGVMGPTGEIMGCHETHVDALKQMSALYANESGIGRSKEDAMEEHEVWPESRASVDNSTWDGPGAMSKAAKSENPARAYAAICAGKRSGDPTLQQSWALPHHKEPGAPPNAAGVRNSLSRLPQTDGLTNADAAQAHLESHLRDIQTEAEAGRALVLNPELRRADYGGDPIEVRAGKSSGGPELQFISRDELDAHMVAEHGGSMIGGSRDDALAAHQSMHDQSASGHMHPDMQTQ